MLVFYWKCALVLFLFPFWEGQHKWCCVLHPSSCSKIDLHLQI